mmetsp:Transcript_14523/g.35009  ORF Transcript_14523/g.35009 Transcript_14523/m.35009 type:complete len:330 (+) Transcript_14523:40-1029(+)
MKIFLYLDLSKKSLNESLDRSTKYRTSLSESSFINASIGAICPSYTVGPNIVPTFPSPFATLNLTFGTGSQCISSSIGSTSHCAVRTSIAPAMSAIARTAFVRRRYDGCSIILPTLGSSSRADHFDPSCAVRSFRAFAAASRMLDMSSPSHPTHRLSNRSVKNSSPSRFANSGIRSMTASRILHFPSSARSSIAGNSDCVRSSVPITSSSVARDDTAFSRTSLVGSRRSRSMGGNSRSIVASRPRAGASSVATIASAARTFSLSSSTSCATRPTRRTATGTRRCSSPLPPAAGASPALGRTSAPVRATSDRLNAAAVRTSASGSCSSFS